MITESSDSTALLTTSYTSKSKLEILIAWHYIARKKNRPGGGHSFYFIVSCLSPS